ncbi:MAG: hypothetical protein GY801_49005 [bacterium]|nr:hypothetical protein [bacterium]
MSDNDTKKPSRTDWKRLESTEDNGIDYADIPPLGEKFFQRAKLYVPNSQSIMLDMDVFSWFAEQGQEYPRLINRILRHYITQHTQGSRKRQGKTNVS